MKYILLLLISHLANSQISYDTIIDIGIYKSYFNTKIKEPIAVTYKLYHGGGNASRDNDRFTGTSITLCDKDYAHSGYDRGHLASAEDFAYSDSLQGLTFKYYNCTPQCPKLNRGKWKKYENEVRELSQKDTVFVVCYNEYDNNKIGNLSIPKACYKTVYDSHGNILLKTAIENNNECLEIIADKEIDNFMISLSPTHHPG